MSLVSYAESSDEYSDSEKEDKKLENDKLPLLIEACDTSNVGHDKVVKQIDSHKFSKGTLSLPAPKQKQALDEDADKNIVLTFSRLPMPKTVYPKDKNVIELDDEFMHKKSYLKSDINKEKLPDPTHRSTMGKGTVKIKIPSLRDFIDVDTEITNKGKNKTESSKVHKCSGLLSILPKAKSELDFSKAAGIISFPEKQHQMSSLIPDSVKHLRAAHNTETVDGFKLKKSKPIHKKEKPKPQIVDFCDSEDSDDESTGDFFSLNSDETLPEIGVNEINIMVAKRAAKMAETTKKYLDLKAPSEVTQNAEQSAVAEEGFHIAQKRVNEQNLNEQALQALVGGSAKRRRRKQEGIEIVDISGDQILPNRDEWLRTALATSTTYQPTGVLVDEEPASGTRRKHQITYLAHKAKANEAELQAMWAANRHTRRATQSKYGF